ncbi:MAG: type II toxin-antitoxin system RelE/ParE family toxin [Deltaproteobacteria bacterium]
MKKSRNVWWSETAENDLVSIIEYVARDNPLQAIKIFDEIKKRAESLHAFPDRGRMVPEFQNQGITVYRELVVGPWRVLYRVSEDSVYVLSVLDSRQNVEDILLQRLIALK